MFFRVSIQAFYASDATAEALRRMKEDRRLVRSQVDIQPGGIQGASAALAGQKPVDLLIVETQETGDAFFASLDALAEVCDPATKVVIVGPDNDIRLYRQLLDMGILDYLLCPVDADDLLSIVERFTSGEGAANARVIAFIGARGGVGSSTVAVNTAYTLSRKFAEDVVLLDLDLAFGTAALSLNILPKQNLAEALSQSRRLDEVMLERFLSHYDEQLSVIAAPGKLDSTAEFDLAAFEALMAVLSRRASFVVLDMPHYWSGWVFEILTAANEVVITTNADLAGLNTTKSYFDKLGPRRGVDAPMRLVINSTGASRKTELSQKDFEKAVSLKPSIVLPNSPALGAAMNDGELIAQIDRKSEPARLFDHLATVVSGRTTVVEKPPRFSLIRGKAV